MVTWYASRLANSFKPAKPFPRAEQNLKIAIPWNHLWLMSWDMLTKITHFYEILLSHDPLFGQKRPKQPWAKRPTFQNNTHTEKRCFNLEGYLWHVSLPETNKSWANWKKKHKKIDCHVMHLKNSIRPKQQSRKKLFSLGSCVWNEKWSSFIILHWYKNYPIVSPLSLIISFNIPTKDHLHAGGKAKKDFL